MPLSLCNWTHLCSQKLCCKWRMWVRLRMTVDCMRMTVDCMRMTVDYMRMTVDCMRMTVDYMRMTVDYMRMTVDCWWLWTIWGWLWTVIALSIHVQAMLSNVVKRNRCVSQKLSMLGTQICVYLAYSQNSNHKAMKDFSLSHGWKHPRSFHSLSNRAYVGFHSNVPAALKEQTLGWLKQLILSLISEASELLFSVYWLYFLFVLYF